METINVKQRDAMREVWKAAKGILLAAVAVIVAVILFNLSTFTVSEGQQAVVLRFGSVSRVILDDKITFTKDNPDLAAAMGNSGQPVAVEYGKGLYFRIPFVDDVKTLDSRDFTYLSPSTQVNTNDKKQYMVQLYAQWRIANPALFYQVYHTMENAHVVLDDTIEPILVQRINSIQATDFLSNKDMLNQSLASALKQMNQAVRAGGIEVVDVQVSRTQLPDANLQSTYNRMIVNREKVAQQLRSEGQQNYQEAKAEADLEAAKLLADATQQSKTIMGQADADALKVYADSYSKDPEFYGYWRSLQALQDSLGHGSTIVLDRNSPLWKDLLDMVGQGTVTAK